MQTVQSSLVRSSYGAQTRKATWINKRTGHCTEQVTYSNQDQKPAEYRHAGYIWQSQLRRDLVFTCKFDSLVGMQRKLGGLGKNGNSS